MKSFLTFSLFFLWRLGLLFCFLFAGWLVRRFAIVQAFALGLLLTSATSFSQVIQVDLNPLLQADPVIIEDNCFIGARSEVAEGVIVEEGSVLSMGVFLGQSTKIIDRDSGEVHMGRVPSYSVVVPGTLPGKPLPDGSAGPSLYCAVIVKRVDEQTRSKTSINDLLRD